MVDLYCGLGGATEGALLEGYDCVGFDLERHVYGEHQYPAQLVIQDCLTLHGSQLKDAAFIWASPPCQRYSWMAMPWSRAKAAAAEIRADETGVKLAELNALFNACFRIQREACEAAGRHIPLIVENVRGAQPWVGRARANFGSFYLWGDVPALMPITLKITKQDRLVLAKSGRNVILPEVVNQEGFKTSGMNWSDQTKRGQDFTRIAGKQAMEGIKGVPHRTKGHWTNPAEHEGAKVPGFRFDGSGRSFQSASVEGVKQGGDWFNPDASRARHDRGTSAAGMRVLTKEDTQRHRSAKRKFASAMIARIPLPLSRWIAKVYLPTQNPAARGARDGVLDGKANLGLACRMRVGFAPDDASHGVRPPMTAQSIISNYVNCKTPLASLQLGVLA